MFDLSRGFKMTCTLSLLKRLPLPSKNTCISFVVCFLFASMIALYFPAVFNWVYSSYDHDGSPHFSNFDGSIILTNSFQLTAFIGACVSMPNFINCPDTFALIDGHGRLPRILVAENAVELVVESKDFSSSWSFSCLLLSLQLCVLSVVFVLIFLAKCNEMTYIFAVYAFFILWRTVWTFMYSITITAFCIFLWIAWLLFPAFLIVLISFLNLI